MQKSSSNESGSWWEVNTKLVIILMEIVAVESEAATILGVFELPNSNSSKISLPRINQDIECYVFQAVVLSVSNSLENYIQLANLQLL